MLERHYATYHQRLMSCCNPAKVTTATAYWLITSNTEPVLPTWNHQWLPDSKTLAEVCDLSEDMRSAMDKGARA